MASDGGFAIPAVDVKVNGVLSAVFVKVPAKMAVAVEEISGVKAIDGVKAFGRICTNAVGAPVPD